MLSAVFQFQQRSKAPKPHIHSCSSPCRLHSLNTVRQVLCEQFTHQCVPSSSSFKLSVVTPVITRNYDGATKCLICLLRQSLLARNYRKHKTQKISQRALRESIRLFQRLENVLWSLHEILEPFYNGVLTMLYFSGSFWKELCI